MKGEKENNKENNGNNPNSSLDAFLIFLFGLSAFIWVFGEDIAKYLGS